MTTKYILKIDTGENPISVASKSASKKQFNLQLHSANETQTDALSKTRPKADEIDEMDTE